MNTIYNVTIHGNCEAYIVAPDKKTAKKLYLKLINDHVDVKDAIDLLGKEEVDDMRKHIIDGETRVISHGIHPVELGMKELTDEKRAKLVAALKDKILKITSNLEVDVTRKFIAEAARLTDLSKEVFFDDIVNDVFVLLKR